MNQQKILFLADPFYSSLAHVARITGLFRQLKRIPEIEAYTRIFSLDNLAGDHLDKINRKSIEEGWLDSIVTIKTDNNKHVDFNRSADPLKYFASNLESIAAEYRQKIEYVKQIQAQFDNIIIITSPGAYGALITSPLVADNVKNILIMDTFYHPASEFFAGTGWHKNSLLGRLQARFLVPRYALPFIDNLNKLRIKLGLPEVTRDTLYDTTVIDPNVPAYSAILHPLQNYYQIGPLYMPRESDKALDEKIQDFKASNKLIYITLGGSVSQEEFVDWVASLMARMRTELGGNIRYIISTGKSIKPDKVRTVLDQQNSDYWVDSYIDIQQLAPHLDLMVGTFGQGQLLMAAKNKCPVIVCPINADQATHAAFVTRLKIGARPYRIKLVHLRESNELIKKALNSDKSIAIAAAGVLKDVSRYQNEELAQQLQNATEEVQLKTISKIIQRICAPSADETNSEATIS